jgi:hypothetical protein
MDGWMDGCVSMARRFQRQSQNLDDVRKPMPLGPIGWLSERPSTWLILLLISSYPKENGCLLMVCEVGFRLEKVWDFVTENDNELPS